MYSCVDLLLFLAWFVGAVAKAMHVLQKRSWGSVVWYAKNQRYGLLSVLFIRIVNM